ncbi:2-amino-4-hydroxy-6-hydroxymethyldihydropteridinepyrophosphokinase [hydrothermal vent metagenome]|uniref:2-amino-4-hydroxy-6-hydroxymethyldihydropteridine diphosphokinase n=1 Tax=hydrothermal vent metagenome TaxID=652676 RepID=A0A3B1D345_9ZZZZ
MNEAIIGLGSNIDPQENMSKAKELLVKDYDVKAVSSFIRTKPVGMTNQPDFLNGAVLLKTELDQKQLNTAMKALELDLGRKSKGQRFYPRTIDLDIVAWNGKIVDQDFYSRDYLKQTVLEVSPNLKY